MTSDVTPPDRIEAALAELTAGEQAWVAELAERLSRAGGGSAFGRAGELLGYELVEMRPGGATIRLADDGLFHHAGGVLMGAVIAGLIDHAMGAAVAPMLEDDELTATADLTVRFLRPVRGGTLEGSAEVIHSSRRSFQVRSEVRRDGELVALGEASFARIANENEADPSWRNIARDARERAVEDT